MLLNIKNSLTKFYKMDLDMKEKKLTIKDKVEENSFILTAGSMTENGKKTKLMVMVIIIFINRNFIL